MPEFLKRKYNKDALIANVRNAKVTYDIIRNQIRKDGYTIIQNKSSNTWYVIPTKVTSIHCPTQGMFNIVKEVGEFNSEADLLKYYLETRM